MDNKTRCEWTGDNLSYIEYHDKEWGRPVHDDRMLFEMLILEGAQAGLSWITILKKRKNYREAFDDFNPHKIIHYGESKIQELMNNPGIVRNRLKIIATIANAKAFLEIVKNHGSFNNYIWSYVDNTPIVGHFKTINEVPTRTKLSDQISKDLQKQGFKFVGSTIIYAFLQAIGVVNDHITSCFIYKSLISK